MTEIVAALLAGVLLGGAVGRVRWRRRRGGAACPDPEAHELNDNDRDQLTEEFRTHAAAVHRQVSKFADALASDDPVLRARLRQFEIGTSR